MPERGVETLFFVDDDALAGRLFQRHCEHLNYGCRVFTKATACLEAMEEESPALVIADLSMPGMDGFELIAQINTRRQGLPVLAITGQSTVERAVQAMQAGAADFLKKPYELEELRLAIERCLRHAETVQENRTLKRQIRRPKSGFGMIGEAPAMRRIYAAIDKLAGVDCPVIIQGESGSGKELVARAVHDRGPRRNEPFVVIDCGCLSDTLLESELFGHKKGAFTGADQDRQGLLEAARGGTVFLDEIGNISEAMQAKLLRVIQEHRLTPVGSNRGVAVLARFIVATHCDLPRMVAEGKFRHDLYHRLNVVSIHVPSLHERCEDIPLLVQHFIEYFCDKYKRPMLHFAGSMMKRLCTRRWEGNVRELRNYIERCVIMADEDIVDTPLESGFCAPPPHTGDVPTAPPSETPLETLQTREARYIQEVLASVGGNHRQAADILGISRTTLWRKLREMEKQEVLGA